MGAQAHPADGAAAGQERSTIVAFLLMILFAGGNPVAVRLGGAQLAPLWNATLRSGGAAIIFWILVLARHKTLPSGRALLGAALYGVVSIGLAYSFLYIGIQQVPASLVGSLLAFVPLATLLLAAVHGLEPLRWQALAGMAVATVGVVLGISGGLSGRAPFAAVLTLLAGVACLAEGGIILKLFPRSDPLVTNVVAFTAGTPMLVALSLIRGEQWNLPTQAGAWVAVLYQIVLASVVLFYLYAYVMSRWSASQTSYMFLFIPVVTVVVASLMLGEVITPIFVVGAALVLVGVWMGIVHRAPKAAELVCTPVPNKVIC